MLDLTSPPTATSPTPTSTSTPLISPLLAALLPTSLLEKTASEASAKTLQRQKQKEEKDRKKELARIERELNPPVIVVQEKKLGFLPREWSSVPANVEEDNEGPRGGIGGSTKVSIMSWNMLAQALVKRDLFPNSDFLKLKDRVPTLMQEVLHYQPDVACLQEVDRLSDHLPSLTLTHGYTSFIGYADKSHGLLIAHKNSTFEKVAEKTFLLDLLPIVSSPSSSSSSDESPSRQSLGLSRSTRNVFLLVALKFKNSPGGIIVGTTHLFWHPQHVYERTRQTGLIMREARAFRESNEDWNGWEVFVAGDFNTQPKEMTYNLLKSLPLPASQIADLNRSKIVHQSVDKLYDSEYVSPPEDPKAEKDSIKDGNLAQHPDKVIRNSRVGTEEDGLVDLNGFKTLFNYHDLSSAGEQEGVRSAYGEIHHLVVDKDGKNEEGNWYVDRVPEVVSAQGWVIKEDPKVVEARKFAVGGMEERVRRGDFEPQWTNFTPLWRCTLDYIFLLPPSTTISSSSNKPPRPRFTALLKTHPTEAMGKGLPLKGVEPSDHIALMALVEIYH